MAGAPNGCGPTLSSVYYNLCDLTTAWGIVTEAVAAAGAVASLVLFGVLVASLPFATDGKRKATAVLQAGVLTFALGLFGLTFAFIVGRYSASCAARRFLFGVLFAGCLACMATHGLWLLLLGRFGRGPGSWMLCLGALALWLVEVIVNAEWLIITLVRSPAGAAADPDLSCGVANLDFVASLVYVMVLLLAVVLIPFPSLTRERWRRDAALILTTGVLTAAIWIAWILMYTHGNRAVGNPSWDDPTMAVAVVTNAWVFLFFYTIPEICMLTIEDPDREEPRDLDHDHAYPPRSLAYDSIRKDAEAAHQNVYMENKAFSMEEAPSGTEQSPNSRSRCSRISYGVGVLHLHVFSCGLSFAFVILSPWYCCQGTHTLAFNRPDARVRSSHVARSAPLAFSSPVPTKPVSPYGAYNGQVRGCVYQPTEIALIAKGLTKASVRVPIDVPVAFFIFYFPPLDPTSLLVSADGPRRHDPSSQIPDCQPRRWGLPVFLRTQPVGWADFC